MVSCWNKRRKEKDSVKLAGTYLAGYNNLKGLLPCVISASMSLIVLQPLVSVINFLENKPAIDAGFASFQKASTAGQIT